MTPISIAILLCLLLAVGATVASCLIPELTIVGGIWGIPVLGFALLVGVVFRVAVYYDPREPQSPESRKYAAYVAASLLCYLVAWSSLDLMFPKGQHIAAFIASILGVLTILGILTLSEYELVMQTTGNRFPVIFEIKRFVFFNSSSIYLLACVFSIDELRNVVKPIVIFFAYANCVSFAAVYCGIYRERRVFASNGTIAERLATWLRSKIEPGELLSTLQTVLTIMFYIMLIGQSASDAPSKNSPIFKGLFAGIAAISCYIATHYDPRKPPETSKLARRMIGVSFYLTTAIYFEWYVQNINQKTNPWNIEVHSVTMIALIAIRAIICIWLFSGEMSLDIMRQKIILIFFHMVMYSMSNMGFVLITILNLSFFWKVIAFTVSSIWYYYTSLFIILVIAGKYREVVRQVPPPLVQQPLEVVVDQGERRQDSVNV
jgi:hypothetical protein